MPTSTQLSELALALAIRCRIASGQPPMEALRDVLGAERVNAMRAAITEALIASDPRKQTA